MTHFIAKGGLRHMALAKSIAHADPNINNGAALCRLWDYATTQAACTGCLQPWPSDAFCQHYLLSSATFSVIVWFPPVTIKPGIFIKRITSYIFSFPFPSFMKQVNQAYPS